MVASAPPDVSPGEPSGSIQPHAPPSPNPAGGGAHSGTEGLSQFAEYVSWKRCSVPYALTTECPPLRNIPAETAMPAAKRASLLMPSPLDWQLHLCGSYAALAEADAMRGRSLQGYGGGR